MTVSATAAVTGAARIETDRIDELLAAAARLGGLLLLPPHRMEGAADLGAALNDVDLASTPVFIQSGAEHLRVAEDLLDGKILHQIDTGRRGRADGFCCWARCATKTGRRPWARRSGVRTPCWSARAWCVHRIRRRCSESSGWRRDVGQGVWALEAE